MTYRELLTTGALTALMTMPAAAQEAQEVPVLATWGYDPLYAAGWSVDEMFDSTEVAGGTGEIIGDVENLIFSDEGRLLGVIAEIGGVWDIADTHIHVPWDEVEVGDSIGRIDIPVTEATVDDYDVFGDYVFDFDTLLEAETDVSGPVNDDLVAGPGIFRASDLIGDFTYLADGVRYGYIADLVVSEGEVAAIVTDAASAGRRGYFAYPYVYRGVSPMAGPSYIMPYGAPQVDTIESFDYDRLRMSGES